MATDGQSWRGPRLNDEQGVDQKLTRRLDEMLTRCREAIVRKDARALLVPTPWSECRLDSQPIERNGAQRNPTERDL